MPPTPPPPPPPPPLLPLGPSLQQRQWRRRRRRQQGQQLPHSQFPHQKLLNFDPKVVVLETIILAIQCYLGFCFVKMLQTILHFFIIDYYFSLFCIFIITAIVYFIVYKNKIKN